MMTQIFILCAGIFLPPLLFRLALKLRLGLPMLYVVLALTVFHDWVRANPKLADAVLFALVGLVALSWVVTLARRARGMVEDWRYDRAAAKRFACRVRQARAVGESVIGAEDLWC